MKKFFVVRLANKADGTVANIITSHDSESEAYKEYYRQLGLAVDSDHLTDSVTVLTSDSFQLDYKGFVHDVPAPDPEPVDGPVEEPFTEEE